MNPFISICIPAYKNTRYLEVLFRSIAEQTFKDYEVVVSDDSPDNEAATLCKTYSALFPLQYHKNFPAKGSPANWNTGIKLAKGQWIKIMHDDDWFAHEHSLEIFARSAAENPAHEFIFSGYSNYEHGKLAGTNIPGKAVERKLKHSALNLFSKNYIGHPSTTLIKNNGTDLYDEQIKWVVDFEFYIRCLKKYSFFIIQEPLINIGINKDQITKEVFRNKEVEIPENFYLLNKLETSILKNILVYDYYWRLLRNLQIRKIGDLLAYSRDIEITHPIKRMLSFQRLIPLGVLRVGLCSKFFMFIAYTGNYFFSRNSS